MSNIEIKIIESWANATGNINTIEEIKDWINEINNSTYVTIEESNIDESTFWFYDDYNGEILNRKRSFFSICGIQRFENAVLINEQPIIVQPEIGYLGIICKISNGVLNFLMQAKIEPGNVNLVQISPTIQATKSNFTRAHGGKLPHYFEYFENSSKYNIVMDQIQSEQATRFLKKRNRNIIIEIDEDIDVLPNYKWMTLGQLKKLMRVDNLVNMDTRTVISGIPLGTAKFSEDDLKIIENNFVDKQFFNSIYRTKDNRNINKIFNYINNYKMFDTGRVNRIPLNQLTNWKTDNSGIVCNHAADFMVRFYDICIHGREVQNWTQPLFKAIGESIFGLVTCRYDGSLKFLVRATPEIGLFDKIELGPSVHISPTHDEYSDNPIETLFRNSLRNECEIKFDVMLSEEGGRFFREQNRNVIVEVEPELVENLPDDYFLVEYSDLNKLVQSNNYLNIQLRNLLALLEV